MSTYTVQIKKQNTIICTFVANANINYDNILWWQLNKLVKILKDGFNSKEDLVNKVENNAEYFKEGKSSYADITIDLDKDLMNKPVVPLYEFDQVKPEECCISLLRDGEDFYAIYDESEESILMRKVSFEKLDLLSKKEVTLDQFIEISNFINELTESDESDYILNNQLVLRFNNI